jgi:hypothetical protein
VKALVDAVNGALNEIKLRTRFDPATNQRSLAHRRRHRPHPLPEPHQAPCPGRRRAPARSVANRHRAQARRHLRLRRGHVQDRLRRPTPPGPGPLRPERHPSVAGVAFVSAGWRTPAGTHDIELRNVDGEWSARIGGEDAAVTVNADGSLRLAVAGTNDRMGGMTVTINESLAAGAGATFASVGQITYEPGVARRVSTTANRAIDAVSGTLTTAETSRKARLREFDRQIEAWETRLEKRELRLRQQYTALESLMGQLGNQATWLSGQISGLNANMSAAR